MTQISDICILIKGIKELTSIPIVILTNGTLLFREDVQEHLLEADTVIPSLDAATQAIFERINRPHNSLKIETSISGLKRFRELYRGQIWLELMLVKGVNDSKEDLKEYIEIMKDEIKEAEEQLKGAGKITKVIADKGKREKSDKEWINKAMK